MANRGSVLTAGQALSGGDYLVSPNGQYCAVMQADGNFVLYWGYLPDRLIGAMWASDTQDHPGNLSLVMQGDHNLVLYQGSTPLWASNTDTTQDPGHVFAKMQDDGNFVLYHGTPDSTGASYWDSGTWRGTAWVKCDGIYVAKAGIRGGGDQTFYKGQCVTINWTPSRTGVLQFKVAGLEDNTFGVWQVGALRSKRFLMGGTTVSPTVDLVAGHGTF